MEMRVCVRFPELMSKKPVTCSFSQKTLSAPTLLRKPTGYGASHTGGGLSGLLGHIPG
jgi:hypothetical protein